MFHVILYQPEIPPNTGNIIRLCANTGCHLHLIQPLGFSLDEKRLRRAGLDYRELTRVASWPNLDACLADINPARLFAFSSKVKTRYSDVSYQPGDALLFGPETRGLPADVLGLLPESHKLTLPMQDGNRSLNLSNSVAIAVYEAWRQCGFASARDSD